MIFDNLILNSIQQNDAENMLEIHIYVGKKEEDILIWCIRIKGRDFQRNISLIPCVFWRCMKHQGKKGHGIGMWIVNNTIANTGGKILKIEGLNGFKIEFMLGDKI